MEERLTVRIGANISEFERKMAQMQGKMNGVGKSMSSIGSSMTKYITAPAAGAVAAAASITAAFGWKRLVGLDSAQAQLKGLGYEIEDVERISEQVNNAVQGTTMTMAEGTSAAAGALAAGVEEGAELEAYIKAVGNAAVGSGREVGEMASIFNRVQGSGKLMTQELNMIEDGMPGFAQAMADNIGVSMEEFRKMVTAGEVSSEDFLTVMDSFAGDMSEAYADSWQGMVANTKAWIGILGENLLSGVFEQSKDSIGDFMELLKSDAAQEWATEMGAKISDGFGRIINTVKSVVSWWNSLSSTTQKVIGTLAGLTVAAGPVLMVFGSIITKILPVIKLFTGLTGAAVGLAGKIASVKTGAATFAAVFPKLAKVGGLVSTVFAKLGTILLGGVLKGISLLRMAFVFFTGPVGIVVGIIGLLGAAFTIAYKKSETFRNFVDGIKDKFMQAIEWIGQFKDGVIGLFQGDGMAGIDILTSIGLSEEMANKLKGFADNFMEFYNKVKGWMDNVKTAITEAFVAVGAWWDSNGPVIIGAITNAFEKTKEVLTEVFNTVKDAFSTAFNAIKEWWDSNGESIVGGIVTAFEWMKETLGLVFDLVVATIKFAFKVVQGVFETFAPIVTGIWNLLWDTIKGTVELLVPVIIGLWDVLWNTIKGTIEILAPIISGIVKTAIDIIVNAFNYFAPIVMGIWNTVWPAIQLTLTNVWEIIKSVVSIGLDYIQSMIRTVTAIMNGDWSTAWEEIKGFTSRTFETIKELFSGMTERATELIMGMVDSVKQWFIDMWENVTSKVTEIKDAVVLKFTELKDGAVLKISEMYTSITTWFSDLWTGVTTKATEIKDGVVGSFTGMKDDAVERVTNMYNSVTGWFGDLKTSATTTATNLKDDVVNRFTSMRDDSNQKVIDMFNWVTGKFGELASWVDGKVTGMKDDTVQAFTWMKDGAIEGVQKLYDGASNLFDDVKNYASDTFEDMVEGAKALPGKIGSAIKNMAHKAVEGITSLGTSMGNKMESVVNSVIGGLNKVLKAIGVGEIDPISINAGGGTASGAAGYIKKYSTGTRNGAIASDTLGMVNDRGPGNGRGGATQELIQRNGQLFAPRGKNAIVPLQKGDRIFNGAETQSLMSSGVIPRFSQGTGTEGGNSGQKKGLFGTLKDVVSDVWSYISNPGKAFEAIISSVSSNFDGFDGFAGKMLSGGFKMVTDGIKNFIAKIFKENEGALGSGKGGKWMNYRMTTPYSPNSPVPGYPTGFNGGRHYGIDYGTPRGTPITATTGGKLSSFWNEGGGKIAKLVTGQLRQFFMHMQTVAPNGSVKAGDVIGKSGNSGRWTTGPHVHWQAQQGADALNRNTIDPRKVIGHANGGIFSNQHVANFAEEGPEAIIPLSAKRRGRANSLYDSVGKAIGRDDGQQFRTMIDNQQKQIERMDKTINVLLGIEDKTGITESDIGRANDKYNARQTSKRGATTGRLNYV